ncbi:MAG: hypothetical protein EP338_05550 [Bacteroidetes bacterium]|nr:MAG: hypothetical protein EP338_05550 [Bacteroidota bacterium]
MKYVSLLFLIGFFSASCLGQVYKPKKRKKDYFGGAQDYRSLRNFGFQGQIGPTYTFTRFANPNQTLEDGIGRTKYQLNPDGNIGAHIDLGMAHFILKKPKYKFIPRINYIDYGIGFKFFRGQENLEIQTLDNSGNVLKTSSAEEKKFQLGYASARVSAHNLIYFKGGHLFLDNALGFHGDYQVMNGDQSASEIGLEQKYSPKLRIQMHYDLGFGIRLKRGSYLIPGVQIPIAGLTPFAQESIHWFSSKYFPALFKIKWIYLFEKKGNGCTNNGTDEDRKRNEEYMQNK